MNITFLVGNGFDISAGIDTSYEEFYKWYCDDSQSSEKAENNSVKKLKDSIKKRTENKNWSDLEIGLADFTSEFTLENSQGFIDAYEDVRNKIVEFIIDSEQAYNYDLITPETLNDLGKGLVNFYQELNPAERGIFNKIITDDHKDNTKIKFISFNYTKLLDSYIADLTKDQKDIKTWKYGGSARYMTVDPNVLHIHGTTDHYPALGVGEEEFVANPDLLQNPDIQDALLKKNHVSYVGEVWYNEGENIIDHSHLICIFGMSLGQSDSLWWKKIMSWLAQSPSRRLIVFWHTDEELDNISVINLRHIIEPVKDKLMAYCQASPEATSKIRNRIHCVINAKKMLSVPSIERS